MVTPSAGQDASTACCGCELTPCRLSQALTQRYFLMGIASTAHLVMGITQQNRSAVGHYTAGPTHLFIGSAHALECALAGTG